ncbi:MAG TPA: four helix bundle protein [Flavobacteriaceae bacterium]|nr:four helix bundle protein [Flavobacteriaceae bacterium]
MKTHKDLDVWKLSRVFVSDIYKATVDFPKSENYGLTNQIRRSAVSVPSNIAEGSARQGNKEFIQFLYIALGSLAELETQLFLAMDLNYLKEVEELFKKLTRIRMMLLGLIKSIKRRI